MLKKQLFVLICLVLGLGIMSCNHGDGLKSGLQKDASRSNKLLRELDNVPRAFAIDKLKKLEIVPEISEQEGTVIGMIKEGRSIVCIDEDVIKQLSRPFIQKHVDQYLPAYRDFKIAAVDLNLFKEGLLLVAFSVVSEQEKTPQKVYLVPQIQGPYIVLPRQAPAYRCSATSCPSNCQVAIDVRNTDNIWCQCNSSGYGRNTGCDMHISR